MGDIFTFSQTMTELKNKKDVLLQQQKTAVIIGRGEKGGGGGEEEEGQADDRATVTNPPTPPLVSVLKKTKREPSSHSDPGTSSDTDDQPPAKKHKGKEIPYCTHIYSGNLSRKIILNNFRNRGFRQLLFQLYKEMLFIKACRVNFLSNLEIVVFKRILSPH